jgi:hypothetical protein
MKLLRSETGFDFMKQNSSRTYENLFFLLIATSILLLEVAKITNKFSVLYTIPVLNGM